MTNSFKLSAQTMTIMLLLAAWVLPSQASVEKPGPPPKFDREQLMILNLNRGPGSTGYCVVEALKQSRAMSKKLDKARRQLEQVELNFAKYKGKPDNRYLEAPAERLKQAEQTAQQLEAQLKDTYEELKSSIQQALIVP